MSTAYYQTPILPWSPMGDDERRFRRILLSVLAISVLAGLIIPFLPVSKRERTTTPVPPRIARLVIEREKRPPPPPPPKQPEPAAEKPKPKPEPKPEVKQPPKPKPEAKPKPEPKAAPKPSVAKAREKASKSGVLAFTDELADLRDKPVAEQLESHGSLSKGGKQASHSDRAIITSNVGSGSRGINTSSLSRDTGGGGALASRQTSKVSSAEAEAGAAHSRAENNAKRQATRSDEEITLVFDRSKSAFNRLYRRALRRNPTLQGTVVVKLTIAPSGEVTAAKVISSQLNDDDLEHKIELRVLSLRFAAKNVKSTTVEYPIDFFPS